MLRSWALPLVVAAVASAAACANGSRLGSTTVTTSTGGSVNDGGGGHGGTGGEDGGTGDGSNSDACAAPSVTVTAMPVACGATATQATLTFDEPVTGVAAGDTVILTGQGEITGITGGPAVYTVSLTELTAPDSLHVLPQGTTGHIASACGTGLPAPVVQGLTFDAALTPTVTVAVALQVACGATSTPVTLSFNEPVTGVVAGDTVTVSGSATLSAFQGGPLVYTGSVDGLVAGGSYGIHVFPTGSTATIESVGCQIPLSGSTSTLFSERTTAIPLDVAPGPAYAFGGVAVGTTAEQTFTVTPVDGPVSGVTATLSAPFAFKDGTYPGTGGTCGATISADCTMVVDYTPTGTCSDFVELQLAYSSCTGTTTVSTNLAGYGVAAGNPTTCASTSFLYVSKGGSDASSGAAPDMPMLTIGAALAAAGSGTEIHVAAGTYPETLVASGCVKLFGGYDPTFSVRNPATNVTSIVASVPNGGVVTFPGAALHLDGFTVTNTASTGEALLYNGGTSVISNNVLTGAEYGMYFFQHNCGAIHDNTVTGAQALYFFQSQVPIYDNVCIGSSVGVTMHSNQGLVFSGNDVRGGTSGIQTYQNQGVLFEANRFTGTSNGVNGYGSTGVVYRNNYVYGGTAALYEASSSVVVADNDIVGPSIGLSVGALDYVVVNNIFLGIGSGAVGISGTPPSSIENNLFFGLAAFVSTTGAAVTTAAGVNAIDGSLLTGLPPGCAGSSCWTARAEGNITTALLPTDVFVDLTGADANVATLYDDDWGLFTSDPTITQGGKDASGVTCGSHQAPRSCGAVTTDYTGAKRAVPYSIGAYNP